MSAQLEAHEKATSNQVAVAIVKALEGQDIAEYGVGLGRAWGIGTKQNNGVLLIVAPNERQVRIAELLERPYRKVIRGDRVEGYLAEAPDLPGCVTAGETEEQALANLREAMAAWLDSALAGGGEIPEPRPEPGAQVSGRMLVRMPPSLHAQLVDRAAHEGVSANQMAVALLAPDRGSGGEPVRVGHLAVHEDHVVLAPGSRGDRLLAALRGVDSKPEPLDLQARDVPIRSVVVCDEHPAGDRGRYGRHGVARHELFVLVDVRRDGTCGDRPRAAEELGVAESGLDRVVRGAFGLLDLLAFFTAGEDKPAQSWHLRRGLTAWHAAGSIHSDIQKGFVRAEVIGWEALVEAGGYAAARDKGTLRLEGRDYVMADGDVITVKFTP